MKKLIALFLPAIILVSCKLPLTEEQLSYLNIADIGDTLIFCSDPLHCDTLIISNKELYYNNFNPVSENALYRPQNASLKYYSPGNKSLTSSLIQIWGKSSPDDSSKIEIMLFYNHWFISESYNDLGVPYKQPVYFKRDMNDSNFFRVDITPNNIHKDSTDLKSLVWNRTIGPVEYVDIHDRKWKRLK